MTRGEILIRVLTEVTGKPEKEVRELVNSMCVANPKIAAGFAPDVPEEEARKQIAVMVAEGPGIMLRLLQGAAEVANFESKTAH